MTQAVQRGLAPFFLACILSVFLTSFSPCKATASSIPALSDEELLEKIQKSAFEYFKKESNSRTGLVRDSANNFGTITPSGWASVAATGFGLTAYGIAAERNWMTRPEARERVLTTLRFFSHQAENEHGFYYHFLDPETGRRSGKSELSPIDTALFLAGALFSAEYFDDSVIREEVQTIYQRIDWPWMLNGGKTFAMAWSPEQGFSKNRWAHFDESLLLYFLAAGSPTHPITRESWQTVIKTVGSYHGHRLIQMPPLFTHQYPHLWIDFRNRHDETADYFQNSVQATLANRQFAIDQSGKFLSYGENSWGLTASNGPFGYKAYGAPPGWSTSDGTVAPTACGTSIMFTPEYSLACLRHFYETEQDSLWGTYGFSDAFNLDKKWFDDRVIGIDQGALLIGIENHRSELVWKTMGKSEAVQRAFQILGFEKGTRELAWPDAPSYEASYLFGGIQVDGYLRDWPNHAPLHLDSHQAESGSLEDDADLSGDVWLGWNEDALFFAVKVKDQSQILKRSGKNIWQDDCFEIFVDPQGNGLFWDAGEDFQLGFSPDPKTAGVRTWSWLSSNEDPSAIGKVLAQGFSDPQGYVLEGMIRWKYLGIQPLAGQTIRLSPAIHDRDQDQTAAKLVWFFRNEDTLHRFVLGRILLGPDRTRQPMTKKS